MAHLTVHLYVVDVQGGKSVTKQPININMQQRMS